MANQPVLNSGSTFALLSYALTRATLAQLGGMFFITSMSAKTLLSRAPCFSTHSAIAQIPDRKEVSRVFPKIDSALLWSEKAIFTSFRGSRYVI